MCHGHIAKMTTTKNTTQLQSIEEYNKCTKLKVLFSLASAKKNGPWVFPVPGNFYFFSDLSYTFRKKLKVSCGINADLNHLLLFNLDMLIHIQDDFLSLMNMLLFMGEVL